jgi:hypothetical protein
VLELPRANLFIADDVGLGKTIEAGLVLEELELRQRVDFVLIVCPASISLQWLRWIQSLDASEPFASGLDHPSAKLELPQHLERAPLRVVVEAHHVNDSGVSWLRWGDDVFHQILALSHLNDVTGQWSQALKIWPAKDAHGRDRVGAARCLQELCG